MEYRLVTAVVRHGCVDSVEAALCAAGAPGMTVWPVMGVGEYANWFRPRGLVRHAMIQVYVPAGEAARIADVIARAAHTGVAGDGYVAVLPVESHVKIREV